MSNINRQDRNERGQVLVIVAVGMVVIIAMVGLVIDGGYAWGRQRGTQNGADASAKSGAIALAENLGGKAPANDDAAVLAAVSGTASSNHVNLLKACYTRLKTGTESDSLNGTVITSTGSDADAAGQQSCLGNAALVGGGTIPPRTAGVKAITSQTFDTYLARVIGINQFTTTASANAVTGILTDICSAEAGCGVLPVTFALNSYTCDGTGGLVPGTAEWPLVDQASANASNEAIVPLCMDGPGSVGWLDFSQLSPDCGNNIKDEIVSPCNVSIPIPTWLPTQTGDTNALDGDLSRYWGTVVQIPIWTNTCNEVGNDDGTCPTGAPGNGNNLYYYIPRWAAFLIDKTYTSGSNPECNQLPGKPFVGGNGANGCFKGWFLRWVQDGPVGPGQGPLEPSDTIGIQLVQ
jgi:Flp pilus assembly protein TadG